MPDPTALVFDFDGVIADSEPAHARSIKVALERLGLEFPYEHDYARFIGKGDRECFLEVAREQGRDLTGADLDWLAHHKRAAFVQALDEGLVRPFDATIDLIRAAAGVAPLAVCSGSVRGTVMPVLDRFAITGCFAAIVTASEAARNKPDPMPYLMAAQHLGAEPAACVAIEDSPTGIRSARAAGYGKVIGVCHSFGPDKLNEAHEVHESTSLLRPDMIFAGTSR